MDCRQYRPSPRVKRALTQAVRFLCAARASDWWRDFSFYVGPSDEWVTAYVGAALAEVEDSAARSEARSAWLLLERRASERRSAFGYNGKTVCDADSSAWACRLAANLGVFFSPASAGALALIRQCAREDGGIATFPSAASVREAVSIQEEMPVDGWISSHACVTAAAALLPGLDQDAMRRYLGRVQSKSGAWVGYWWMDCEYATALATQALADSSDKDDIDSVRRAVTWMQSGEDKGSSFTLALRVLGICASGLGDAAGALDRLLSLQLEDGSWPASARLRQPPPSMRHPASCWYWDCRHKGFGSVQVDTHRVFTTATAIRALNACSRV